ncbi:expressed unknown protein [Seminavis robusta]|uniref:CRAL-TRIO domain-containing protein n=1 Tax=Seminavis robusta TaxID=568900 RepID=A0A9N8D639_9STRA|nr:expressed unknown protein [Seminavis robusta]|eukprot:Sro14_g010470.1 n/a (271) ;mRNA; f:59737-60549
MNFQRDIMALSQVEKERAEAIKNAIAGRDDLKTLPDFEIAHLAIVRGENMDRALDTAYKMQCFREELKIIDTAQDGLDTILAFMNLQPGFLLELTYLPFHGTYSWSCDYEKLNPSVVRTREQWRTFQGGFYYMMRCAATDFHSIRTGLATLSECEGMGSHNFDIKLFEKAVHELWSFYPARYKETVWLHTPSFANFCYSMLRKIVSQELADSWRIGEEIQGFEGRRLTELFHIPNFEVATINLVARLQRYLTQRYHNEHTFELDNCRILA